MKAIRSRKGLAEAARAGARAALAFVMTVALCIPDAGLAFAADDARPCRTRSIPTLGFTDVEVR